MLTQVRVRSTGFGMVKPRLTDLHQLFVACSKVVFMPTEKRAKKIVLIHIYIVVQD